MASTQGTVITTEGKVSRAILVAHSMSVYHSIRYCADNPDHVAKLVLIDIEARCRPEHRDLLRAAGRKPHPIFASLDEAIARERRSAPFASAEALANFVESNLTDVKVEGDTRPSLTYRFDRATLAQFDDYDEWTNLGRIRCPALLVYGEESQLVRPEVMQAMKEGLIAGHLAGVPRAGHFPMLDNPNGFAEAVVGFCTNGSA